MKLKLYHQKKKKWDYSYVNWLDSRNPFIVYMLSNHNDVHYNILQLYFQLYLNKYENNCRKNKESNNSALSLWWVVEMKSSIYMFVRFV